MTNIVSAAADVAVATKKIVKLSPLASSVLTAVLASAGTMKASDVATTLGTKPASVSGAMATLKKNEMIKVNSDGTLKVLRAGKSAVGALKRAPKAGTKIAKAKDLFVSMPGAARKDVIAAMTSQLGISQACAATYYATAKSTLVPKGEKPAVKAAKPKAKAKAKASAKPKAKKAEVPAAEVAPETTPATA